MNESNKEILKLCGTINNMLNFLLFQVKNRTTMSTVGLPKFLSEIKEMIEEIKTKCGK